MFENVYQVYVRVNENNVIIQIESNLTLSDTSGFIYLCEGAGDKYAHAQGNYFPKEKPIMNIDGTYNYKLVNNIPVELTDEEKKSLFGGQTQPQQPTELEKVQQKLEATEAKVSEYKAQMTSLTSDVVSLMDIVSQLSQSQTTV